MSASNKIPFFDLTSQNKQLSRQLNLVWKNALKEPDYILGSSLERFEQRFADYVGSKFAVGVANGLEALSISLKGLGVGSGDEVILPAHTFVATALAVTAIGAKPVLVDVDEASLLLDLEKAKKRITRKTKAVIPVHLYGQVIDLTEFTQYCHRRNVAVVEDACQAHGACHGDQAAGSFGDAAAFSFYPSKNLGAFGDGGLLVTRHEYVRDQAHLYRNYGSKVKYHHEVIGQNSRLDSLQAAILDVKLGYLKEWNAKRKKLTKVYHHNLSGLNAITRVGLDYMDQSSHHLYVIRLAKRDQLASYLKDNGVGTGIHYPIPIHLQPAFRDLRLGKKGFYPVAERAASELLSLPLYPELSVDKVERVCALIAQFFKKND